MKNNIFCTISLLISSVTLNAQELLPLPLRQKEELKARSWVRETPFEQVIVKEIGNRISALNVNPKNSNEFLVAPENGGIWLTQNGGETYTPLCPTLPTQSISAIAMDWTSGTLALATPYGIFISVDKGKTTKFSGLTNAQHISSLYINPLNPQEIVAGVLGNSYKADEKRGIFKTTDGGNTWQQKLFVSTRAGISQITPSPDGSVLLAVAWDVNNSQWENVPYGSNSGVYKSTDGGNSWTKITTNNGFIKGNNIGKIGVTCFNSQTYYAVVDNRNPKKKENNNSLQKTVRIHLTAQDFDTMSKADFLALDNNRLNIFLHNIGQDNKYTAQNLKDMIAAEVTLPAKIFSYLGVSTQEIIGAEVYVTNDGGNSWQKANSQPLNDMYYQNGEQFGGIAVNLTNKNHLFIGGYPLLESGDGGKTWRSKQPLSLQNSYEQLYLQQGTLFCTTPNGLQLSYDNGRSFATKNVSQAIAFSQLCYDQASKTPYYVSEQAVLAQNNSHWNTFKRNIHSLSFGNDSYAAEAYGKFFTFFPDKDQLFPLGSAYYGENKAPLRFSEKAPLLISPQNKDIIYIGSNKLHISMDKGRNWRTISDDVTNGNKQGNKAYGTISAIAESPFMFGLLYTGSDDGMIYTTDNGGVSWKQIYNAFPRALKVNNLIASKHQRNRVLATLISTDETQGDPIIFMSNDNGKSWTDIHSNLPDAKVNVLKEDSKNEQILYAGTDNGLYITFNLGESWQPFSQGLPETGVNDIYIDDSNGEMTVATLGRGIYRTSVKMMQELRAAIATQAFFPLETPITIPYSPNWGNAASEWDDPVQPKVYFYAFAANDNVEVPIKIMKGRVTLQSFKYKSNKGFNYIPYDLSISPEGKLAYEKSLQKIFLSTATDGKVYLPKGRYTVIFTLPDGFEEERTLDIF
jgi:BNR/asp-box repeat domain protein